MLAAAFLFLLTSGPVIAEAPRDIPARAVRDNVLTSSSEPEITLRVAQGFTALPSLDFPIENLTWAQRRIFVDVQGGEIRRMVVVQFERVQDGASFRFRYSAKPPRQWGAQVYRFGAYDCDTNKEIALNPDKEEFYMRKFYTQQRLHAGRFWRTLRLARVTDRDGMSEMIVFYMEALSDKTVLSTPSDDSGADIPAIEGEHLWDRFKEAVTVSDGS